VLFSGGSHDKAEGEELICICNGLNRFFDCCEVAQDSMKEFLPAIGSPRFLDRGWRRGGYLQMGSLGAWADWSSGVVDVGISFSGEVVWLPLDWSVKKTSKGSEMKELDA